MLSVDDYWQQHWEYTYRACILEARARQLGVSLDGSSASPAPQRSHSYTAPRPQSPAPRAPVQAPVAQMPSNADPSIARGLAKIAQLQPQCGSRRVAVGNENAARGAEIDAAKVVEEADWLNLESVTRQAAAKVTDNSVYSRQADYRACLYAAEGRIKKAQPSTVQYTPSEARGAQIAAAFDGRCRSQKIAAERRYGSVAELVADNRIMYDAVSGSPAQVSAFNAAAARNAQNEPANADIYGYWSCIAQARLQQMDDGSASSPQTARVDTSASEANFRNWQKSRSHNVNNHADDATDCLSVVKTGTKVEWGTSGKFKLINTCSYPVEAAWCANTKACEGHAGNLWTIGAGRDYPIFFADESAPDIRVGACRVQSQRTSKVDVVADGRGAGQIDTSHKPPQPAPGVSIMQDHSCD
jgi:hypothetical protein